jgi:hypothetical protein
MADEQWPPNHGLPAKKRFKKARSLKWGETPFDDMTRGELLRLVQAYHSAVVASQSAMSMVATAAPSGYWMAGGSGGRALAKCNVLMHLAGERDPDPASENIYRSFFRSADVLLFPHLKDERFSNWGVNDKGDMVAPYKEEDGFRAIEWRDVLPQPRGAGQPLS